MRQGANFQTKIEKGREFGRIFLFDKNFGEFRKKKILFDSFGAFLRPKSARNLCLFHFYTKKFIYHASVAYRQRQTVCKTVAVTAVKVQILPDAPVQFRI